MIHAPVERVTDVLARHDDLADLLDNDWLSLTVVDPTQDHDPFHYDGDLSWTSVRSDAPAPDDTDHVTTPAVADD